MNQNLIRGYYVAQIEGLYQIREVKKRQIPEVREKEETCRYDFTPNGVDLKSFPHNAWRKLSKEILLDDEDGVISTWVILREN